MMAQSSVVPLSLLMKIVLYTVEELAAILRLNKEVVRRKLRAGQIAGVKIGNLWRVEKHALSLYLEKSRREIEHDNSSSRA